VGWYSLQPARDCRPGMVLSLGSAEPLTSLQGIGQVLRREGCPAWSVYPHIRAAHGDGGGLPLGTATVSSSMVRGP